MTRFVLAMLMMGLCWSVAGIAGAFHEEPPTVLPDAGLSEWDSSLPGYYDPPPRSWLPPPPPPEEEPEPYDPSPVPIIILPSPFARNQTSQLQLLIPPRYPDQPWIVLPPPDARNQTPQLLIPPRSPDQPAILLPGP